MRVDDGLLEGSDGGDRPHADQANFALLRGAPHLYRERDNLGEQDGRQHDQVLIAAENRIHTKAGTTEPVTRSLLQHAGTSPQMPVEARYLFTGAAMPRKTSMARLSRTVS